MSASAALVEDVDLRRPLEGCIIKVETYHLLAKSQSQHYKRGYQRIIRDLRSTVFNVDSSTSKPDKIRYIND